MRNRSHRNMFNVQHTSRLNEDLTNATLCRLFPDLELRDKSTVLSVKMIPSNARQCRVRCNGETVFADAKFYPGDIIEICPCREISKQSLYTRDVRDMVFEVERNSRYVIPMGYCQYYAIIDSFHKQPNCNWKWDAEKNAIIIKAIDKIQKGDELILDIEK